MIDAELLKKKDKILQLRDDIKSKSRSQKQILQKEWYRNCLDGDTKIDLLDGSTKTIRELSIIGKPVWAYGFDTKRGMVVPTLIEKVWSNGRKECVDVALDGYGVVRCTEDHRILTWFNGYVEAGKLKPGDSLIPFFTKQYKTNKYLHYYEPVDAKYKIVHRMVASEITGREIKENHVHHKNEIKNDNRPENLEIMTKSQHMRHTALRRSHITSKMMKDLYADPVRKEKRVAAMRKTFALESYRKKKSDAAKSQWQEKRGIMMEAMKRRDKSLVRDGEGKFLTFKNHRVVSVTPAGEHEVFDFYAPRTENVAISNGIFVHNCLFFVGRQWIRWNRGGNKWEDAKFSQSGKEYPRPVTNKFASCVNTIKVMLTQQQPRMFVRPNLDTEESIAAAEIGDTLVDVLTDESGEIMAREIASSWLVITGNTFFQNGYYIDKKNGEIFIPHYACGVCGKVYPPDQVENGDCPTCEDGGKIEKAIDQHGNEVGDLMPKGRLKTDSFSGFEAFFDQTIEDFNEVTQFVRSKSKPLKELKEIYPAIKDKISDSKEADDSGRIYLDALAVVSNTNTAEVSGGVEKFEHGEVDYLWVKQTEDFPQGLIATCIGNEIAELTNLDEYRDSEDNYFLPFVHIGSNRVPGRLWHKTLMDDVCAKQIQRNKLESFIELIIYTMSGGKWLTATGNNMTEPDGDPNQVLEYEHLNGRPAPDQKKGLEVNQTLIERMEMMDKEIDDLSATYEVLKGQLPAGLDTYSGLRLLTERAASRHAEMKDNWERGLEQSMMQKLWIAQRHFVEPRKKTFENANGIWETKEFTKADLAGGLDIKVEKGSTMGKSKTVEDAALIDAIKLKLINSQDPKTNFKILERLGMTDMASSISDDIKDAKREWKTFFDNVIENPEDPTKWEGIRPRQGIDNEPVHYQDAMTRAKSEEFFSMPKAAQALWLEHVNTHKLVLDQQMAQQAAMGQPPEPAAA